MSGSGEYINYAVVACSTEDKSLQNEISRLKQYKIPGNKVCWVTEKNHKYPQSLTLKLEKAQNVGRIDLVVHPKYTPSSVTVAFGLPEDRYGKNANKANGASYTIKGTFSFLEFGAINERQTLYCDDPALYMRFTVHGYHDNPENEHRQICIAAIVIRKPGSLFASESSDPYASSYTRGIEGDDLKSKSITTFKNPILDNERLTSSSLGLNRRTPSRSSISPYSAEKYKINLDTKPASPIRTNIPMTAAKNKLQKKLCLNQYV